MPTLRSVADEAKKKAIQNAQEEKESVEAPHGEEPIKEPVMKNQPTSELLAWIDVLPKLLPSLAVGMGFTQMAIYVWYYQIPFPLSLSNFVVLLTIVAIFSLVAAAITLVVYIINTLLDAFRERGPLAKPFFKSPKLYILLGVIIVGALLPGSVAIALKEMGIGGGMKVVYHLSDVQMDNAPQNILENCSATGCVTKPLYLMIDGGDMVYVKLTWDRESPYYGIRKSQIVFIERLPDK